MLKARAHRCGEGGEPEVAQHERVLVPVPEDEREQARDQHLRAAGTEPVDLGRQGADRHDGTDASCAGFPQPLNSDAGDRT